MEIGRRRRRKKKRKKKKKKKKKINHLRTNPRTTMKPITILRNQILTNPLLLQPLNGHMSRRRNRFKSTHSPCLSLSPLCFQCPSPLRPSKIRDSSIGGNASSSENDEVRGFFDKFGELVDFFFEDFWGVVSFFDLFRVGVCCGSHVVVVLVLVVVVSSCCSSCQKKVFCF